MWDICNEFFFRIFLYVRILYTDHIKLPLWAASALDTLPALYIDLSMDVVAYQTHMWHWDWSHTTLDPLKAQWFGIPFGNFVGWLTVLFCYSAFSRLLEEALKQKNSECKVFAHRYIVCGLINNCTFSQWSSLSKVEKKLPDLVRVTCWEILCLTGVSCGTRWNEKSRSKYKLSVLAWYVPAWFHMYFGVCFLVLGFYKENVLMSAVTAQNQMISIVIHGHMITMSGQT